jgi:hypothetical protein
MNYKLALLGLLLTAAVIFFGCAYGSKRVTYNTLAGVEIGADQAMQLWGDYVAQFHPPVEQEKIVADAYGKYQLAEEAAIDATVLSITLASSGNKAGIADAQSKESTARLKAQQTLSELLKLLQQFGVKLQ